MPKSRQRKTHKKRAKAYTNEIHANKKTFWQKLKKRFKRKP